MVRPRSTSAATAARTVGDSVGRGQSTPALPPHAATRTGAAGERRHLRDDGFASIRRLVPPGRRGRPRQFGGRLEWIPARPAGWSTRAPTARTPPSAFAISRRELLPQSTDRGDRRTGVRLGGNWTSECRPANQIKAVDDSMTQQQSLVLQRRLHPGSSRGAAVEPRDRAGRPAAWHRQLWHARSTAPRDARPDRQRRLGTGPAGSTRARATKFSCRTTPVQRPLGTAARRPCQNDSDFGAHASEVSARAPARNAVNGVAVRVRATAQPRVTSCPLKGALSCG